MFNAENKKELFIQNGYEVKEEANDHYGSKLYALCSYRKDSLEFYDWCNITDLNLRECLTWLGY